VLDIDQDFEKPVATGRHEPLRDFFRI
jgi:hypothetical protein